MNKYVKIGLYLTGSWLVSVALVSISNNPYLVGLAPLLNFVAFVIEQEVKKEREQSGKFG